MSTRYVWDRYNIVIGDKKINDTPDDYIVHLTEYGFLAVSEIKQIMGAPRTGNPKPYFAAADGAKTMQMTSSKEASCGEYPYIFKVDYNPDIGTAYTPLRGDTVYSSTKTSTYKWVTTVSGENITLRRKDSSTNQNTTFYGWKPGDASKGSTNFGVRTSKISSEYPQNGYSRSYYDYWYVYKGSDEVDPYSVSASAPGGLRPGASATVQVNPRTPTYGGTISYIYQYKVNGGSWQDIQTTTSNSVFFSIPSGMRTIQFRVQAKDDTGFLSNSYVTSQEYEAEKYTISITVSPEGGGTVSGGGNFFEGTSTTLTASPAQGFLFVGWKEGSATVSTSASYTFTVTASRNLTAVFRQKLALWIGVSSKARKGEELHIGVTGNDRKVTSAYIGVNGKARRFL